MGSSTCTISSVLMLQTLCHKPAWFNYVPSALKKAPVTYSASWTHRLYGPADSTHLLSFHFWPCFSRKGNSKAVQIHTLLIRTWHATVLVPPHLCTRQNPHVQSTSDTGTATHAHTRMHDVYQEGWCLNLQESQVHLCWVTQFRRSANSAVKQKPMNEKCLKTLTNLWDMADTSKPRDRQLIPGFSLSFQCQTVTFITSTAK